MFLSLSVTVLYIPPFCLLYPRIYVVSVYVCLPSGCSEGGGALVRWTSVEVDTRCSIFCWAQTVRPDRHSITDNLNSEMFATSVLKTVGDKLASKRRQKD